MPEFVALMAMLSATIAFSIDAMLPALPQIGRELSPGNPNAAQLVIVAFVVGMGAGTLFTGPLSDAVGRKRVMLGGAFLYCVGAALCTVAPTLETMIAGRIVQGLGASGPRVAAQAMIRDLYAGRAMARVSSFVMMTFTLVPAIAPLVGALIIAGFSWRGVFWAFVVFSAATGLWLLIRQPETMPPALRRPLNVTRLRLAAAEVFGDANVRRAIAVQTLVFAILFACITSVQPIYDLTFGRADSFPLWFGIVAVLAGSASFLNARLVVRLGMLWLIRRSLSTHVALSVLLAGAWIAGILPEGALFPAFVVWQVATFALAGLSIGNLNAIAMQPMGHIAGMASSVISATATIAAMALVVPIGLAFDGTPLPLILGSLACGAVARLLSQALAEG
ncbi:multidrug effflux MFS transporter [Jannaschia rubra]|uniref:Sulfonamide resistance protein n=1 Tax=Jannaschia rubra TaxID=282197 RepID=A0A0M6XV53_9RHOB|nr:multidrug effflux MFS transporter [Jannaschia rubra]CTQ33824.1 Sulfonamide resistance protein [Jannaschia rubra]SFG10051.1 MFS transporter, DHA1 family, bicyclomycin/chloramphenicol resistance protein [Jannaschia rubra]